MKMLTMLALARARTKNANKSGRERKGEMEEKARGVAQKRKRITRTEGRKEEVRESGRVNEQREGVGERAAEEDEDEG